MARWLHRAEWVRAARTIPSTTISSHWWEKLSRVECRDHPWHGESTMHDRVIPPSIARDIITKLHDSAGSQSVGSNPDEKANLEAYPHVVETLTALWGCYELKAFLKRLILSGSDRNPRAGFPQAVYEELVFLYNLFLDNESSLLKEKPPQAQLDQLAHEEKLRRRDSVWNAVR